MKKRLTVLTAVILALTVILASCGGSTAPASSGTTSTTPSGSTSTPSKDTLQLTMGTGSSGGTYFALGGAMANTWNKVLDGVTISAQSTGASVENMRLIQSGELEMGLAMNSIADDAWHATGKFDGTQTDKVRAIGVVYPEVIHIVALGSTNVTTLEDFKGKKFAIGPAGSGSAIFSEILFKQIGIDLKTDLTAEQDSFGDAAKKMQDGHLDGSLAVLSVPASSIVELETSRELNFINISDEVLEAISKDYPYYTRHVIPANTYKNSEPINTVTCQAALYCSSDLSEEDVYNITKAMYENVEDVAAAHPAGASISLETAIDGITTPIHKGAAKYYAEMGITVPAELIID